MRTLKGFAWGMTILALVVLVVWLAVPRPTGQQVSQVRATATASAAPTRAPKLATHDMTSVAANSYCNGFEEIGRDLASIDTRAGMRPVGDEVGVIIDSDTFTCVFTSGEAISFNVVYLDGSIVQIR